MLFQLEISELFSLLDAILTVLDPESYSQYGSGSGFRGAISNPDPHASGSRSETMNERKHSSYFFLGGGDLEQPQPRERHVNSAKVK